MQNPLEFYHSEKKSFEEKLSEIKKRLIRSSAFRLFVFLLTTSSIYFFFGNLSFVLVSLFIGICIFTYLVTKHSNLVAQRNEIEELIRINDIEISCLNGNFSELNPGNEFVHPEHFYSYDIDLFGKGSFFQYSNRTAIKAGTEKYAKILTENSIHVIEEKQEAIKELGKIPKWRQKFSAIAKMIHVDTDSKTIVNWIASYTSFLPDSMRFIPTIFSIISLALIVLAGFGFIPFSIVGVWFFIGLGIIFKYFKKINELYQNANHAKSTFSQYYQLLQKIEQENYTATILIQKQQEIQNEQKNASQIFKEFSKVLDALDQRNNMLFGVFGNGLLLWDLQQCYKIEQWIQINHSQVEKWFEVIAFFDAYNTLGNFAFNHPQAVFPTINEDEFVIKAQNLGHPLINKKQRVDNDFTIQNREFFIITGANMAGKSTFLRTVSVGIVMANIGLPVFATTFHYSPIKLITSMRTTDSLSEDTSYFFSELKRLKFIVDAIKTDNYFVILDEILKGTNSTDKAIGSKKFVKKLVGSHSTGIIATHDLSLCEIECELTQIKNFFFDAEIINNELHFDYHLKNGVCKNMNASFLLQKMEIV
jgi:hypothetical protein